MYPLHKIIMFSSDEDNRLNMNDADDADAGDDGGGDDGDTEEEGYIFFSLKILTQALDDPFAEVGSDIDLETGDALGGDGGDGGGDAGGKIESI